MILNRFQDMRKFATILKGELPALLNCGYGEETNKWVTTALKRRLDEAPLRAYFVAKMGQWLLNSLPYSKQLKWKKNKYQQLLSTQLPLIFESIITIQYLHNQILDGKSGVTKRSEISSNILQANLLKEQLYRYIDNNCPAATVRAITATVRRCFEYVDIGQQIEMKWNTAEAFYDHTILEQVEIPNKIKQAIDFQGANVFIEKIKTDLPAIHHSFVDIYFTRIYLTCAALFSEATLLLANLFGLSKDKIKGAHQFSVCYGLMRQLVNDNADWLPSSINSASKAKQTTDVFCDMRNGVVTLPLLFFLSENATGLIPHILRGNMAWSPAFETPIFEEMLHSNALYKSIQNVRILGELAIAYLPQNSPAAAYLADSCEIVHWNKYLVPCLRHQAYPLYRQTAYYKRTKKLIKNLRKQRNVLAPSYTFWQQLSNRWIGNLQLPSIVSKSQSLIQQEIHTLKE